MKPSDELILEMLWEQHDLELQGGNEDKARELKKEIYAFQHNRP